MWLNRSWVCVGSYLNPRPGGGRGATGPKETGEGWWWDCDGGVEDGEGGEVPPRDMSESSESLPPPGLRGRLEPAPPGPDCCCNLEFFVKNLLFRIFCLKITVIFLEF